MIAKIYQWIAIMVAILRGSEVVHLLAARPVWDAGRASRPNRARATSLLCSCTSELVELCNVRPTTSRHSRSLHPASITPAHTMRGTCSEPLAGQMRLTTPSDQVPDSSASGAAQTLRRAAEPHRRSGIRRTYRSAPYPTFPWHPLSALKSSV